MSASSWIMTLQRTGETGRTTRGRAQILEIASSKLSARWLSLNAVLPGSAHTEVVMRAGLMMGR